MEDKKYNIATELDKAWQVIAEHSSYQKEITNKQKLLNYLEKSQPNFYHRCLIPGGWFEAY